jgi:hypothetical protein
MNIYITYIIVSYLSENTAWVLYKDQFVKDAIGDKTSFVF